MNSVHMGISHIFHWSMHFPCPIMLDSAEAMYMYEGDAYGAKVSTLLVHVLAIVMC